MSPAALLDVERTMSLLPDVPCVMTAAFETKRAGILVRRVVRCSNEPVCVAVAVPKGMRIATLIRDSHCFALNLLDRSQRLLVKKFDGREEGDPFDTLEVMRLVSTSPVIVAAAAAFDCEVMRHFDLESDHELYVGQVLAARTGTGATLPGLNGNGQH